MKSAFKHCQKYYGMKYRSIRAYQMQDCIDNCGRGYSTQAQIKVLWGHLDEFAFECDIISKMYSQLTTAPPVPETSRMPFTPELLPCGKYRMNRGSIPCWCSFTQDSA